MISTLNTLIRRNGIHLGFIFLLSYLVFDLLIPYTSSFALLLTSISWILGPVALGIVFSSKCQPRYTILIYSSMLISICIVSAWLPKVNRPGDASEAVSYGSFSGVGPSTTTLLFGLLILISILFSFILFVTQLRSLRKHDVVDTQLPLSIDVSKHSKGFNNSKLLLQVFVVLLTCPFFEGVITSLRNVSTGLDFDSQQISAWFDFASQGKVPMRDFWFPYNGMIYFQDGLIGYFLIWFSLVLTGFLLISIQSRDNMYRERFLFLFLVMIMITNYQVISVRYIFPLVALLYLIHNWRRNNFSPLPSLPFAFSLWMSPEVSAFLLVFYVCSLGLVTYGFWLRRDRSLHQLLRSAIFVLVSVVSQAFFLVRTGSAENNLLLLLKPLESIQYSFSPLLGLNFEITSDLSKLLRIFLYTTVLFVWTFSIAQFLSFLRTRNIPYLFSSLQLLLISTFGVMLLQKELIRGGMTLWVSSLLTLSLLVAIPNLLYPNEAYIKRVNLFSQRFSVDTLVFQILLGLALLAFATPVLSGSFTQIFRSPQQIKHLVNETLANPTRDILQSADWNLARKEINKELGREVGSNTLDLIRNDFFVLGDRPDFYRALSNSPYWIMSSYNMSPIREQNKVLREIKLRNPTYLIVDKRPQALVFDGIQSAVRLYPVYQYLIPRYSLFAEYSTFDILKRTESIPNLNYWTNLLGKEINLGFLPAAATQPLDNCGKNSHEKCGRFVEISPELEGNFRIQASCPNDQFFVVLAKKKSEVPNWISLDRLWFWSSACSVKLPDGMSLAERTLGDYLY